MSVDPLNALPLVPDTALPADVRKGSTQDKQTYRAALGFERELLTQLTQAMNATAQSDDSGDDGSDPGSDPATSLYTQMLPEQLADSLVASGGTGLADNLYRAMREGQS